MDFNDDRSNFTANSQMALDLQNVQQNDFHHQQSSYDDLHLLQYFMNDDSQNYGNQPILNQCEQPNNSVLLTNPQSSNSLKAQNSAHPSQQQTNLNSNRSHINQTSHHFYQSQNQQAPPPQFHNQTSTSKQFQPIANNLSNLPINQQQINYVNIPSKDDSLIYSDVVNHNPNNLNNQIYNNNKKDLYHSNRVINNGVNHQLQQHPQQRPQMQHHPQINNLINKNTSYSNDTNLSSPNSLPPIKNNNLLIKNTVQQRQFYSPPPPSYSLHHGQNNLQANNLQQQQTGNKFINNNGLNYNFNDTNNNANNTINNNNLNNVNSNMNNVNSNLKNNNNVVNNVNLIKLNQPKIQDNQTANLIIDNNNLKITQNNLINNSNSINSNLIKSQDNKSQLNELNKIDNLDNRIINKDLKIDNNINVMNDTGTDTINKTIDITKSPKTTKTQKAETKTIVIFKIIDQVFLDGNLVKETIVKNDEIIKHTGYIDWPKSNEKPINSDKEQKSEIKNDKLIKSTEKLDKNLKKSSPKTNLKRSIKQNSSNAQKSKDDKGKEKKIKTEIDQKLNDEINLKDNQCDVNSTKNNNQIITNVEDSVIVVNQSNNDLLNDKKENNSINNESFNQATKTTEIKPIINSIDEPVFIQIEINKKVLAKWSDKNWYSGVVLKQENDKYKIKFDDGASKSVRNEEILNIEFIPKFQSVMFVLPSSQGFCGKGVIKSYRKDESTNQKYYLIEQLINNEKIETEHRAEDVFLTSEAGLSLISKRKQNVNDSKFADVDLNNIIPRSQRTRVSSSKNESFNNSNTINDKASTPSNFTTDIDIIDNDSNSNLSNSTTSSSIATSKKQKKSKSTKQQQNLQINNNNISLNEDTNSNLQDLTSPLSIKSISESLDLNSNDLNSNDDLLGPLLGKNNSSLFKSFAFLISSDEKNSVNSVEQAGFSIPFDLNHLIRQIKSGNGLILDNFEDIKDNYQAVLISHSFAKTIKYITALSLGVPCVKYTFITDSCKKNELVRLEDYILPLGYSILSKQLIQDRTICKKSIRKELFKGTKIYLISTDTETTKWLPLLKACRAIILETLPENMTRKQNFVDFIVTDKTCPSELQTKANNLKIPLVSIEYIIASLIHGKKLSTDIHPTFKHNYTQQKIDLEKKN